MIILKSAFNNGMRACWSLTVNTQLPLVCVLVCEELKCTRDYEMTVENGVCIVMRLHLFRELHVWICSRHTPERRIFVLGVQIKSDRNIT
jgi:hypothetical protein